MSRHAVLAAQREVIRESFHGRKSAYLAALRQAHATVGIALSVLGDELRRARLEQLRYAPKPTAGEVAAFYSAYPDLLVRRVHVSPAPPWLAARTGFAVEESAPQRLFSLPTGRKSHLSTLLGTFAVRPLGAAQPLGALPLSAVRPAIVAALRGFERAQSFEHWTIAQQNHRPEPDDLPPRPAAAAGGDRPHRVPPLPPDPVGTTAAGHSLAAWRCSRSCGGTSRSAPRRRGRVSSAPSASAGCTSSRATRRCRRPRARRCTGGAASTSASASSSARRCSSTTPSPRR